MNQAEVAPYLEYKEPGKLAKAAQILIGLIAFNSISVIFVQQWSNIFAAMELESLYALFSIGANIILVVNALLHIGAGIVFIIWMRRLHRNLSSFKVEGIRFGDTLCIFAFFIPVINLYLPMAILNQCWKASDPNAHDPIRWKNTPSSMLVIIWWLLLLFEISINVAFAGASIFDRQIVFATTIINVVGNILAILVIRSLSARQVSKHSHIIADD